MQRIGVMHCEQTYRYETPRQGVLGRDRTGIITLDPHRNFEQALKDLGQFERIWLVFVFHHNAKWKPLVRVPRHRTDKVGVFATRAPYRPNPIGLTCARLLRVNGRTLHVSEIDLLDGTPILDIKPYLPYADSFATASTGWVEDAVEQLYAISYSETALRQADWLRERAGINLRGFIEVQLQHSPTNTARKRITLGAGRNAAALAPYVLAYRTWRIRYRIHAAISVVHIESVESGYSAAELEDLTSDRYGDKALHAAFLSNMA